MTAYQAYQTRATHRHNAYPHPECDLSRRVESLGQTWRYFRVQGELLATPLCSYSSSFSSSSSSKLTSGPRRTLRLRERRDLFPTAPSKVASMRESNWFLPSRVFGPIPVRVAPSWGLVSARKVASFGDAADGISIKRRGGNETVVKSIHA